MYLSEDLQQNKLIVKNNFITILAAIIVDLDVSATAVRIYCYLAYKANCWQFCNRDIKVALGIKSDHSISKYFKELIDGGYLSREEIKNNGRFAGYQYYLTTVCQKMTNGKNEITDDESRMLKNDNRQLKEEKEKSTKKEKEELFNNNININNNNQKEKNIKKEKKSATIFFEAKNELDLEFVRFLDYRKEIKKPYKSQKSVDAMYKKFLQITGGSIEAAKAIVDKTIENQWQGLFELKSSGNGRYTVNSNSNAYDIGIKA